MKNLLNPKWLYFISTLPVLILFFVLWGEYSIIRTMLKPETTYLWISLAIALAILSLWILGITVYLDIKKQKVPSWFAGSILVSHILYLYVYAWHSDDLIPWSIPRWMLSGDVLMYAGTFLMPAIAFSTLLLMLRLTPGDREYNTFKNVLATIAVPFVFFLFSMLGIPLYQVLPDKFGVHFIIIIIISGTVFFLFFLVRLIYIIALKRNMQWAQYQLALKILVCILLPLLGLAINNGHFINGFTDVGSGMFGDMGNPWFYILAIINGVLLCVPNRDNRVYRTVVFVGRVILFPFTLYFFIVFLPFLPFSVLAIILIGIGFLLLVPLMLFIIHLREIMADISYLKPVLSPVARSVIFIAGLSVIPACITFTYMHDKATLNEALAYIYTPDYEKEYNIDGESLNKTLDVVSRHKDRSGNGGMGFFSNRQIPYLSAYFQWLVLDNMTLSDRKINLLQRVFTGKTTVHVRQEISDTKGDVKITSLKHSTKYNAKDASFISTIDLELTNNEAGLAEYATAFTLPAGCWINDYYLYVGDRKEKGILAEKKAATWVYDQIRNENRDPGILYYTGASTVAFKVFPFQKNEVRKTGISFIHKEPVNLFLDGKMVQLGETLPADVKQVSLNGAIYVSAAEKATLMKIKRKPYMHFVIDVSSGNKNNIKEYGARIDSILKNGDDRFGDAKYTFSNTYNKTISGSNWRQEWDKQSFTGGFFAERAIREILYSSYKNPSATEFPVIILITDGEPIIQGDFSDLEFTFPEYQNYTISHKVGDFDLHSLVNVVDGVEKFGPDVLLWPKEGKPQRYLRDDGQPEIILTGDNLTVNDADIQKNNWNSGLLMHAQQMQLALHPETTDEMWLAMVKHSFKSGTMTPHTSYLVVENEAQKAVLKKKQDQVLSGNKSLDLGEDVQRMSEPGLWLMVVLISIAIVFRRNRNKFVLFRKY